MASRRVVVTHVDLTQNFSAPFIGPEVPSVCVQCLHVFTHVHMYMCNSALVSGREDKG